MEVTKRARKREIFGWSMFDFANSSYTTVIISVSYGVIFSQLVVPKTSNPENPYENGNWYWGLALGLSYLLVVVTGPIFGAITDYTARKKLFLFISYVGCVITTASLWFVLEPGMIFLGVLLIILSNFFFASGENFASSFLPFLGPKEDLGKISGYAWSIGYLGGIASVALVKTLGEVNPDNFERLRLVGPYTGAFFLLAGIPTFLLLREYAVPEIKTSKDSYIVIGFKRLYTTIKSISDFRDLAVYLVSLFFAMAALNIAVSFAFIYGNQEIKTASEHEVWMFLLIQIFAAGGALAFGYLQDRIGAKVTFNMTLVIWIAGLLLIYEIENLTGFVNSVLGSSFTKQWVFVALTAVVGMCLGSTQSASRAMVGVLAPEAKSGEFFGLWGLSGKLAGAFGLIGIGALQMMFSLKNSFLAIAALYVIALAVSFFVNEKRGMEAARNYREE